MPLGVGENAPPLGGEGDYRVLVFYKVSCPTCQLTLPFVERMYRSYGERVTFLGIVQDPPREADAFAQKYGLTFRQLIDDPSYEMSLAYDVRTVPTIYLVSPSGKILFMEEGFVKSSMEELNEKVAGIAGAQINPLFEDVSVPAFKAG